MNTREEKYFRQGLREGATLQNSGAESLQYRIDSLSQALGLPAAEAAKKTVADYQRRLEALPSLTKYPELAGMRECVLTYDQGLAQSSGWGAEGVMIFRNYLHTMMQAFRSGEKSSGRPPAEHGCTLVYFPDSDRGPLLANNLDDPWLEGGFNAPPAWPVANRAGLSVGAVSNGLHNDEVSDETFPAPVYLMAYEMCGTTGEVVELLTRFNEFWGPCNFLVADQNGDSAIVEKSSCRYGLRKSRDGFSATTAMAAENEEFKKYLWQTRERSLQDRGLDENSADWTYWKAAENRSQRLLQMLDDARDNPTFEAIEAIIYDHNGQPDQINLAGEQCHPEETTTNWTLRTAIHVLNENQTFYSFADPPRGAHLTPRHRKDFVLDEPIF